jgi:hypothetical protein
MASTKQDVTCYAGETVTINVAVTSNGVAFNLAGYSIKYQLATATPLIKTIGSGITVTDAVGGLFTITLSAANTSEIPGAFKHACKIKSIGAVVSLIFVGTLTINDSVVGAI